MWLVDQVTSGEATILVIRQLATENLVSNSGQPPKIPGKFIYSQFQQMKLFWLLILPLLGSKYFGYKNLPFYRLELVWTIFEL